MSKEAKIVGQLVIVAYKARYLPEREIVGKQDPFVVFRIGETIERTKTDIRGGQHPVWDDQVVLPIPEKKTSVVVQVYDEDGKRQQLISECDLDISKVLQDGEEDNWYPLKYRGRDGGEIYLEMTFYAARPPPKRQPTRFGVSRPLKHQGGYVPTVPPPSNQQPRPNYQQHQYPPQQHPPQPSGVRPPHPQNQPVESHSTPTFNGQQQHQPYNYGNAPRPYPPPNPTPSISTSSQHSYPPTNTQPYPPMNNARPYGGQPPLNTNRPNSPPVPLPNSTAPLHQNAPLLSSSYNPTSQGYPPNPNSGYPPQGYPNPNNNNRNSYPGYNAGGYPPQNYGGGFPEPQHFPGGYAPHADNLGTPFAAHQGAFQNQPQPYPPTNTGYPPQQGGYPPSNNYPPY